MTQPNRRRADSRTANHDADVKRIVVSAVVVGAMGSLVNMCALAAIGAPVPDQIDRLTTLLYGALIGFIGKAVLEMLSGGPMPVTTPPGEPLQTEDVTKEGPE